ncbi:MAG TPA: hypothetical protein VMS89_02955 [Methanoregulaceae archaeon]|nr:hypothetical protein [Methanoregulaceae archaeon]
MIFPRECKEIGFAETKPCGDRVYFLSDYGVRKTAHGYEIIRFHKDFRETGLMRTVHRVEVIVPADDVTWYTFPVNIHDRAGLIRLATESGTRATIFRGLDEHITFIIDPDLSQFLTIHVYDLVPPSLPSLSYAIRDIEATGMFENIDVMFSHHLTDTGLVNADVHPCRAAGFTRTLDADPMHGGELIAGCRASAGIFRECYGEDFQLNDICPLNTVKKEPFITRCCQTERIGPAMVNGLSGSIIHFGASPPAIYAAVVQLAAAWRSK